MTAKVCKKCSGYVLGRMWCVRKGVYRSPWDDMCDEELAKHSKNVSVWLEGHGKGKL